MGSGGHFNKALEDAGPSDFLNKINSLTISKIVHYGVYCNFQENDAIEGL